MEASDTADSKNVNQLASSELIIGLACAVGTDMKNVISIFSDHLKDFGYETEVIKISKQLIEPTIDGGIPESATPFQRVSKLMDQGNAIRKQASPGPYCILASGAAHCINQIRRSYSDQMNREDKTLIQIPKKAFIIDSLKHPDEVEKLREIYPFGFYMFVVNESYDSRIHYLSKYKNLGEEDAEKLITRDVEEKNPYGQHTRAVFELADFHLSANVYNIDKTKNLEEEKRNFLKPQIERILDLIFGNPFITPTFDEYAMFMAYSSGLRSADLSRQVGAVITQGHDIVATGANDVACFGGGQYWPDARYQDFPNGRDYKRGRDSNKIELQKIVDEIVNMFEYDETPEKTKEFKAQCRKIILRSSLKELTEYGRPVHAEMAAILSCARNGISTKDATLYCSTFPCHVCAKHIVSSGIKKVVYIEPYPKSRSLDLFDDSITITMEPDKVAFSEFVGIGPRRFYDLFSLRLSSGNRIRRKETDGYCIQWNENDARVRCQMISTSYIDKEALEALKWEQSFR